MYYYYQIIKYYACVLLLALCLYAEEIPEDIVPVLYSKYIEAIENVSQTNVESQRRFFKNKREYKIHVRKLKDVNGFKTHNLLIKETFSDGNPIIYINNPVETKIPHAFLTLDEFKKVLTNRVQKGTTKFVRKLQNIGRVGGIEYATKVEGKLKDKSTTDLTKPTNKNINSIYITTSEYVNEKFDKEITPTKTYPIRTTKERIYTKDFQKSSKLIVAENKLHTLTTTTVRSISVNITDDINTKEEKITTTSVTTTAKAEVISNKSEELTTTLNDNSSIKEISTFPSTITSEESSSAKDEINNETVTEKTVDVLEEEKLEGTKIIESGIQSSTAIITKPTRPKQSRPYVFLGGSD